jgi:diaminopimelate epimerase
LPLVVFDGIAHAIAPDIVPKEAAFCRIKGAAEERCRDLAGGDCPPAIGVMFYDTKSRFMTPAVYVAATDSLVFESSCGSGAAALAAWKTAAAGDGEHLLDVEQPGGVIAVRVRRQDGEIAGISIGGPVKLSGRIAV